MQEKTNSKGLMEGNFTLRDVIYIVLLVVAIVGSFFGSRNEINMLKHDFDNHVIQNEKDMQDIRDDIGTDIHNILQDVNDIKEIINYRYQNPEPIKIVYTLDSTRLSDTLFPSYGRNHLFLGSQDTLVWDPYSKSIRKYSKSTKKTINEDLWSLKKNLCFIRTKLCVP